MNEVSIDPLAQPDSRFNLLQGWTWIGCYGGYYLSADLLEKYLQEGQELVEPDMDRIKLMGLRPMPGNFMSESDTLRHDPLRLAAKLMEMV